MCDHDCQSFLSQFPRVLRFPILVLVFAVTISSAYAGDGHVLGTPEKPLTRFHFESVQMGGPWGITIYANDEKQAEEASVLAFKRVTEINNIFSDYSDKSELAILMNDYQENIPHKVSDEFFKLTKTACDYSAWCDGSLDISVGPLTQFWRRSYRKKEMPDDDKWQNARKNVGFQNLQLNENQKTILFKKPGMILDFGALAKGYAADEALSVLKKMNFLRALVDGNGNFSAGDPPPGKKYWTISVMKLHVGESNKPVKIKLVNQGVSTSGDMLQSIVINSKRYSHIIDPQTGKPQQDQRLVTVVAENGLIADMLSTILCIKGESFLPCAEKKHPGIAVFSSTIIQEKQTKYESKCWKNYLVD